MANSEIKIIYFNVSGRAEICRLVLAAAGKKFDDVRVTGEEWQKIKPTTPFGTCPVLDIDGKQYGQSKAISSYLAAEFGLYGKTNLDQLQIDQVAHLWEDFTQLFASKYYYQKDEAKKAEGEKELKEEVGPRFLGYFEKMLKENGTGYIVGDAMTLADIYIYDMCTGFLAPFVEGSLDRFPLVKELKEKVGSNEGIKAFQAATKSKTS